MMIFLGIVCVLLIILAVVVLLAGLGLVLNFIVHREWVDLAAAGVAIAVSVILCVVVQWIVERWLL